MRTKKKAPADFLIMIAKYDCRHVGEPLSEFKQTEYTRTECQRGSCPNSVGPTLLKALLQQDRYEV